MAIPPQTSVSRPRSATRDRSVVKKKTALIIAYDGANYHGLQQNENVVTISSALETALHAVGAISDDNFGNLNKIKWQIAARTDRGVSAAGNVVAAKLQLPRDEMEDACALDMLVKRINAQLGNEIRVLGGRFVTNSFSARTACGERWYEYILPIEVLRGQGGLNAFRDVLGKFVGSKWFHNYTIGDIHTLPVKAQASRYMKIATCDTDPVEVGTKGNLFVRIQVRGQSFMLHQIRKMVSMAILTFNGDVPEDAIERSFRRDTIINIPPAPAEGLFLDCCLFSTYNERFAKFLKEPLDVASFEVEREQFKHDYIFPSLAQRFSETDVLTKYHYTTSKHPVTFS